MFKRLFFKLKVKWFFWRNIFQIVKFVKNEKQTIIKDPVRNENFIVEKDNDWRIIYQNKHTNTNFTCLGKTLHEVLESYKQRVVIDKVYEYCDKVLDLKRGEATAYLVNHKRIYDTLFNTFSNYEQ